MNRILHSGKIFTCDHRKPWAQAVAIKHGKIHAVGTNEEIKSLCSKNTDLTDLKGKLLLPGFTDSHCHFITRGETLNWVNLKDTESLDACRQKISEAVKHTEKNKWIIGFGWNENLWNIRKTPGIHDLDDIAPENPVMLIRVCTHSICVNSRALQISGIDQKVRNLPAEKIDRDAKGNPTGIIREAQHLIEDHIPEPGFSDLKKGVLKAQEEALKFGITCVHSHNLIRDHDLLTDMLNEGSLKIRVFESFQDKEFDAVLERGFKPNHDSDRLWGSHIKLFADGSLGAETAYLFEPYESSDHSGIPFINLEDLIQKVKRLHALGWSVAIHAIGDRAVSNALTAIIESREINPGSKNDRIEHIQLFRESDLALFRAYAIHASVQPVFLMTDMKMAERLWGMKRCENAYAWKKIMDAGIHTVFGSDSPIESCNPILGLHAAVNRTSETGEPKCGWFPDQRLTLEESIYGYTSRPVELAGKSHILGSISPGCYADLTILSRNLFELPHDKICDAIVTETIIEGDTVYSF